MKLAMGAMLLLLAAPIASADGLHEQQGPLSLDATLNDVPSCAVPTAGLPCPAGYDSNDTLTPTDDTLYAYRALQSASITVTDPRLPDEDADLDLTNLTIHHHGLVLADDAALALVSLFPSALRDRTTVYSYDTGTVISIMGPGLDGDAQYNVPIFFFGTDRNGTTLPNGVLSDGIDTDTWVPAQVLEELRLCSIPQLGDADAPTCDALPARAFQRAWPALSPRVVFGIAANDTAAHTRGGDVTASLSATSPVWKRGTGLGADVIRGRGDVHVSSTPRALLPWTAATSSDETAAVQTPASSESRTFEDAALASFPWLLAAVGAATLVPAAWLLYQRITGARVLQHRHRQRIREHLRDHPGSDLAALAAATGLSFKTVAHHVGVLRRAHVVRVDHIGRRTCISLAGDEARGLLAMATRHPTRVEVLRIVQARPGIRQSDVARVLRIQRSTLHRHVRCLLATGILVQEQRRLFASHHAEAFREAPPTSDLLGDAA